jgi:hypothetical protein
MSAKTTKPDPDEWMRLLAGNRLYKQSSRSGELNAGPLGVMAVDVAGMLIAIGTGEPYPLSILALLLLTPSFILAMRTLRLPNAREAGPTLASMRTARDNEDARAFEDSLLDDLEEDLEINDETLHRRALLFGQALTFLMLAILVELAGRTVQ